MASREGPLGSPFGGYGAAKHVYELALLALLIDLVFLVDKVSTVTGPYFYRLGAGITFPPYFPSLTDVYSFPLSPGFSLGLPVFGPSTALGPMFTAVLYTLTIVSLSPYYLGRIHGITSGTSSSFSTLT